MYIKRNKSKILTKMKYGNRYVIWNLRNLKTICKLEFKKMQNFLLNLSMNTYYSPRKKIEYFLFYTVLKINIGNLVQFSEENVSLISIIFKNSKEGLGMN